MSGVPERNPHPTATAVVHGVFGTAGIIIGLLGLYLIAYFLTDLLARETRTAPGTAVGIIVFSVGMVFWGFNLARTSFGWRLPAWRRPGMGGRRRSAADKERAILALAAAVGGRVTLVEVAGRCDLTIAESEELLNALAARGVADLLVADDGTVVYDFDFLSRKEKAKAKDLLES